MRASIRAVVGGVFFLVAFGQIGCTKKQLDFCSQDTACSLVEKPICDLQGIHPASGGIGNTCIAECDPGLFLRCAGRTLVSCAPDGKSEVSNECPGQCLTATRSCDGASPIDAGTADARIGVDSSVATDARLVDSGLVQPDAALGPCDPVTNVGCSAVEKCTFIVDSQNPFMGHTGCVASGAVGQAGNCMVDDVTGIDDCSAGLYCIGGLCQPICTSNPDSCGSSMRCVARAGLFDDRAFVGTCEPACAPYLNPIGCPGTDSCFVNLSNGEGSCAISFTDYPEAMTGAAACATSPGTQDCNCIYLNGCASGFGCALDNDPVSPTGLACAFYCDASPTPTGPSCADAGLNAPEWRCAQIRTFYDSSSASDPRLGMCVNSAYPCRGCTDNTVAGCEDGPGDVCAVDAGP